MSFDCRLTPLGELGGLHKLFVVINNGYAFMSCSTVNALTTAKELIEHDKFIVCFSLGVHVVIINHLISVSIYASCPMSSRIIGIGRITTLNTNVLRCYIGCLTVGVICPVTVNNGNI